MIVAIIVVLGIGAPWAIGTVVWTLFDTNDRVKRIEQIMKERGKK